MELKEILAGRLHQRDIAKLASLLENEEGRTALFALFSDPDERVAMNAMWVCTHFRAPNKRLMAEFRENIIDMVLTSSNASHKRLMLNLLEQMPWRKSNVRADFLDWCLCRINSTEPYAIRAFALRLAYLQFRFFPENMQELLAEIDIMGQGDLPPGLRCARLNVLKQIEKCK